MVNRQNIGALIERANPVPEPDHVCTDRDADALFAAISRRREVMVLTDQKPNKQEEAMPGRTPRYRRRVVVVVAALLVMVAVPAVAVFIDWDIPPLGREFPEGPEPLTVFGPDEGVGEYCAGHVALDPTGTPVLAGFCGVLRLEGDAFTVVTTEVGSYVDMAVAPDGTVWLADVDGPIRSVADGQVTEHSLVARQVEVTSDGSVYAIRYGPLESDASSLMRYEGGVFVEAASGPFEDIAAAPDGSLRTISAMDFSAESGATLPAQQALGRMHNGVYSTEPIPEGFEGFGLTVAPDGALWVIGDTGRIVDRGGLTDVDWALVRYDGASVSTIVMPFPEPVDFAFHPDGTIWASSSLYGAFAYDGDEWVQYGIEKGLPDEEASFVEIGPDGSVYVGTRLGVTRIMPGSS